MVTTTALLWVALSQAPIIEINGANFRPLPLALAEPQTQDNASKKLAAEFDAAARRGVITLMSMDGQHAREDIQRLIDSCTGLLKTQLEAESGLMLSKAEDSKVVSKGTVEAVAVESVSDNSGVVLVAAKTDVTNADNTKRPPALWRLSVNLERDGGQLKMSKVDFLQ